MLRISRVEVARERVHLRLDGQISGRWVVLLRRICDSAAKNGARIVLDVRNISFADREGIVLLRALEERGAEILDMPAFIAEQIKRETP